MDDKQRGELRTGLVRYVRSRFRNVNGMDVVADDIVSEAWIAAAARIAEDPSLESFAYLSAVCANLARRVRAASAIDAGRRGDADPDAFPSGDDPAAATLVAEVTEAVVASLAALRDVELAIVVRRYWRGERFAAIAAATGINPNTVLSHHRRALARLRSNLAPYMSPEPDDGSEAPRGGGGRPGRWSGFMQGGGRWKRND